MDELYIKTKFMRNMLSNILETVLRKKTGYKVKIQLNAIQVSITEEVAHIHIDVNGEMNVNEFKKISRIIELEDWLSNGSFFFKEAKKWVIY